MTTNRHDDDDLDPNDDPITGTVTGHMNGECTQINADGSTTSRLVLFRFEFSRVASGSGWMSLMPSGLVWGEDSRSMPMGNMEASSLWSALFIQHGWEHLP